MEEYEPHIVNGGVVYAGVDYEKILREAEKEADVIIWDGGNNDMPFFKPDLTIVVADPRKLGAVPASIQSFYEAMGRGEVGGFTVPAVNIRGLTYDVARAYVRAVKKHNVGAFIFEIAKSEIGYTFQRPSEYTACVLAACVKEGYQGPVFIQGDHVQVSAKKYAEDPQKEIDSLKSLVKEEIEAEFYNIDIDSSTLVDLSKPTLDEQQRPNYEVAAEMTEYIRKLQPQGIEISIGGEIGEVGGKNSTPEELRAYMAGYLKLLAEKGNYKGISKISVQTGTTHGGVPLPDGTIAQVKIDFETLRVLSEIARREYGLSGAVQHGASTLPEELFDKFPQVGTAEIHLATEFQNMIYSLLPDEFKKEIYEFLKKEFKDEWKSGDTEEQFIYKTRKKGFGPFKKEFWDLPQSLKDEIGIALEKKFSLLLQKLNVVNTYDVVRKYVKV
ncbi:class II fructose-bisphosphate aldolase [Candidatus Kryptobacter tengchongensis]